MIKLDKKENHRLGVAMGNAKMMKGKSKSSTRDNKILNNIGRQLENKFDLQLEKFQARMNLESYNHSNLSFKSQRNYLFF